MSTFFERKNNSQNFPIFFRFSFSEYFLTELKKDLIENLTSLEIHCTISSATTVIILYKKMAKKEETLAEKMKISPGKRHTQTHGRLIEKFR